MIFQNLAHMLNNDVEISELIKALNLERADDNHNSPEINVDYKVTNNFQDALQVEKSFQPYADKFYKENLYATTIKRYDWNDPVGKDYQKKDIDCSVEIYAPGIDVFWLNISEKFRQNDWGDMCIELWSDFEGKKPGWATIPEGPDMYLYLTPKTAYEVWKNNFFNSMIQSINKEWSWERINDELSKMKRRNSSTITIHTESGDPQEATLLRTWTEDKYFGVCVSIPWRTLFSEFLIDVRGYRWNGTGFKNTRLTV